MNKIPNIFHIIFTKNFEKTLDNQDKKLYNLSVKRVERKPSGGIKMKKFRVFYVNDVTGEMWDEVVLGADANKVWKTCEAMLERDVSIDGVYAVEKFF